MYGPDVATPDDTLHRMGELVRTIRQLAASELALRTALELIARRGCEAPCGEGSYRCPSCIAATALVGGS